MKKVMTIFVYAAFVSFVHLSAQTADSSGGSLQRPFQFSFVSPMGTNGMESAKCTNNFSFNILAGYAGGLNGFELGGFSNLILHDAKGTQIAGFCNTVLGETRGGQISGFSNVSKKSLVGVQIAGFSNVVVDYADAIQISGFSNVVKGSTRGAQLSGFMNYSNGDSKVAQIAGFSNVTRGSVEGAQISGFTNYADGDSKVIQIAGFANNTRGSVEGAQISGFSNVCSRNITGVQISGFLNVAKKVTGSQISFINISDTIENGIALGFLSFVKKGYHTLELGGDETLYGQLSFKMGTEKFYNILSIGAKQKGNDFFWGWGYGVGTMLNVSPKLNINVDLIGYHINEDYLWTNKINMLNKLKLNVSYRLTDKIAVYGGPTYNVFVTNRYDSEGAEVNPTLAPWTTYSKARFNTLVQMYPGFTAGIRFF